MYSMETAKPPMKKVNLLMPERLWRDMAVLAAGFGMGRADYIRTMLNDLTLPPVGSQMSPHVLSKLEAFTTSRGWTLDEGIEKMLAAVKPKTPTMNQESTADV
jgi:hypothetical protein